MEANKIAIIIEAGMDNINTRREEINNTLKKLEIEFTGYKSLIVSSGVSHKAKLNAVNARREEMNVTQQQLEAGFAEYTKVIQEWMVKEISAL